MSRILIKGSIAVLIFSLMFAGVIPLEVVQAAAERQVVNQILYVKPGGTGDCLSWDTACDLNTANDIAEAGTQIWVAAGTYIPFSESYPTSRNVAFILVSGVSIYGGFNGTETELSQRDWETNVTILSGEIGDPATTADNIIHMIVSIGQDETAVLDGFTISGGNANAFQNL
ncbi:MAG: hypothetical protein H0S82_00390, partial [Anaerolineaceae bacterium]|nr:hypothetical protein [Anaerolineaceae bacterium]